MSNLQSLKTGTEKANQKKTLISLFINAASTYEQINFKFQPIFFKQINENSIEIQKVESSRSELLSKIEQINSKIFSVEDDRKKLSESSKKNKAKLESDLESLTKSKDSEIASINDEISYKTDLCSFFETFSSIRVSDKHEMMEIQISLYGESMNFNVYRNDEDNALTFDLISCTKPNEQLPNWCKSAFSVKQQACFDLIQHVYDEILR